jgi:hypothetical protein
MRLTEEQKLLAILYTTFLEEYGREIITEGTIPTIVGLQRIGEMEDMFKVYGFDGEYLGNLRVTIDFQNPPDIISCPHDVFYPKEYPNSPYR